MTNQQVDPAYLWQWLLDLANQAGPYDSRMLMAAANIVGDARIAGLCVCENCHGRVVIPASAAEPTCNCFAPRVCPVHGQRYVWPESGEASFAHKPGCAILTAAGNPACSCGALKSTEPSAPHGPACECCVCIAAEIGAMKSRGES